MPTDLINYKIPTTNFMLQNLYRVEQKSIDTDRVYHSKDFNYGSNFDHAYYKHFLNSYLRVMQKNDISVDFLVSVNNQIYMKGNDYLQLLSNAMVNEEYVDIYKVTENTNHRNQKISISSINDFIQSFDDINNFIFFENGIYLWEMILEIVRINFFKNCPQRFSSVFFFDDIESCNYYISKHLNGIGKIYQIERLDTESIFESDMKIIDNIENQIKFEDLINEFANYWRGKMTTSPVKEVIFQGTYKYKSIAS